MKINPKEPIFPQRNQLYSHQATHQTILLLHQIIGENFLERKIFKKIQLLISSRGTKSSNIALHFIF